MNTTMNTQTITQETTMTTILTDQDQELDISEIKAELEWFTRSVMDYLYSEPAKTFGLQVYNECLTLLGKLQLDVILLEVARKEGDNIKQHNLSKQCVRNMEKLQTNQVAKLIKQKAAEQKEKPNMKAQTSEEKTIGEIHKEAQQAQSAVFPAVGNEEGLCLTIQTNDSAVKPVSGNRYAPVETVYFVDPSDTISDTVRGVSDPLVVTLARLLRNKFVVHSVNGINHYHVLGTNVKMVGLSQEVVCDKVLYWAKIREGVPELNILNISSVDSENGWTQEGDLLQHILPLKYEGDKIDPVLEAALRCAPKEALKSYLDWAEEFHYGRYPDAEETLKHLQGG